jgi:hypothetical protein
MVGWSVPIKVRSMAHGSNDKATQPKPKSQTP